MWKIEHLFPVQQSILAIALLAACASFSGIASAENHTVDDIAPFRLTSVDGHLTARYLLDDQEYGSTASEDSFVDRTTWETELFLGTKSYVYHPGFLNMDIGGGPLLVQQTYDSNGGTNDNGETLFNFLGRLNFLDLKNYPFSVFYERSHPSITTGISGRFLTEQDRYGFAGKLHDLWSGSNFRVDLVRWDINGSGFGNIVDEDTEDNTVTFVQDYRSQDRIELKHHWSRRDSTSGSLGLPIQQAIITLDDSEVRATNAFGRDGNFIFSQFFRQLNQKTETLSVSELENRIYAANGRWNLSEASGVLLRYNLNDVDRVGSNSRSQDIDMRYTREASEYLSYDAGLEFTRLEQIGFNQDVAGARGSFSYSRPFGAGTLGFAGGLRMDRTDQASESDTIQVFDEPVILTGTTQVALANDFVISGSVVVSNATQTQTYVEDLDYRLIVIGSTTLVQRLIDGNITDGELVLVDYRYQTSGTAEFDTLGSNLSVTLGFLEHFTAFSRLTRRDSSVSSGQLTVPLNDLQSIEIGATMNLPLVIGWTIEGQIRHVDQDEEISPYVRDSVDIGLTGSLPGSLKMRLSGGLTQVDFENSVEDVDQVNYGLVVSGRLFRRLQFDLGSRYLLDTGGTLERRQLQHRLNLQWVYRQVRFALRAQLSDETLGASDRRYTQVTAFVTRAF